MTLSFPPRRLSESGPAGRFRPPAHGAGAMKHRTRVVRLVAFAALSGVLTVWIGRGITGGDGGARYELAATFDNVAGMYDGDDVKLADRKSTRLNSSH